MNLSIFEVFKNSQDRQRFGYGGGGIKDPPSLFYREAADGSPGMVMLRW